MNNKEKLDFIKNFYNNISDDELKIRLQKAGFEIVEGIEGKILVDDELFHIEDPDFTIPTVVHQIEINKNDDFETFSINYNLGATA